MNILMLGCHSVHEYDEAKIFQDCGHNVFNIGDRWATQRPELEYGTDWKSKFLTQEEVDKLIDMPPLKMDLSDKMSIINEKFDVIYIISRFDYVWDNWEYMKNFPNVVLRLNGQSNEHSEACIKPYIDKGLKIISYSPEERLTRWTNTEFDAEIRFYKDPNEWTDWTGQIEEILTVNSNIMRHRDDSSSQQSGGYLCNPDAYFRFTKGMPASLYGYSNEDVSDRVKCILDVPFEDLKQAFRDYRVYYYCGTRPASYTLNFIEGWMTGVPIATLGSAWGTREVPHLIEDGVTGFVSDNIHTLRDKVIRCLDDPTYAREIGQAGREKAIEIFGIDTIKQQWIEFFNHLKYEF